jgi:hypothetical protein
MTDAIREINVSSGSEQENQEVEVVFGPHHGLRIYEENDEVHLRLVNTHHGFEATASGELPTELEEVINLVREERPELIVDTF